MVLKLLSLGGVSAKECSARVEQILTLVVELLVYYEILLLCSDRGVKALSLGVSEKSENTKSLRADSIHRAQKRRFRVKRLSRIRAKGGGNIKSSVLYEGVRAGVPRGVASRLKGSAKSARGEGGSVRLALDKLLARELHNYSAVSVRRKEGVVLLGGKSRQRLEPMRIVRSALLYCPFLHCGGDGACYRRVYSFARSDSLAQGLVNILGQALAHNVVIKYHTSEHFGYVLNHLLTSA